MQSPYRVPPGISAVNVAGLAAVVREAGAFVSAYVQVDPEDLPAAQTSLLHWKGLRRQLANDGAGEDDLDAIEALVADAHREGVALGVVASGGQVRVVEYHDEPLVADLARTGALPSLAPLIEWRERRPAYVVALVDRAGADLVAFGPRGQTIERSVGDEDPHDPLLHKMRAVGWAYYRMQHRVEAQWEADAKAAAAALAEVAGEVGARLVVAGGDVRALELLEAALPTHFAPRFVTIPASRAASGGEGQMAEAIARAVADHVAREHAAALAALRELVSKDLACTGAAATLDALSQGRVEALLVNDDPSDTRTAAFARDPFVAATSPEPIRALGREPATARLVDVAIAGALSSGATVRVVPAAAGLHGGIGALLRFVEPSPPDLPGPR